LFPACACVVIPACSGEHEAQAGIQGTDTQRHDANVA